MKQIIAGAVIISSIFMASCGNNADNTTATTDTKDTKEVAKDQNEKKFEDTKMEDDAAFAVKAADGGMLEVALGKLAMEKATSPKVKEFGQMMVTDHSKVNGELMDAAKKKNISVPAGMSDKCQKMYSDLSAKKGAEFDKDFMAAMVDSHEDAVSTFKKESEDGKDADLKMWAGQKLPALQQHLATAKSIKESMK